MARRYDSRTTIFSPEGRLYQVEYAMEAISHAGTALGVHAKDGIVLAAEKKSASILLEQGSSDKLYAIAPHIACAVAGITADANTLVGNVRAQAQRYRLTYKEDIPVEQLVLGLCDMKQGYTQYGGLRPFGVSFLYAGYDHHYGFQLYQSDPSGNFSGWKAACIGSGSNNAQSLLKQEYKDKESITLAEAKKMAVKVLSKTMDATTLGSDKLEFATLSKDATGKIVFKVFTPAEIEDLLKEEGLLQPKQEEK